MHSHVPPLPRRRVAALVAGIVAALPFAALAQQAPTLGTVTVTGKAATAAEVAPSSAPLEARSAQSVISDDQIRNFTTPAADYAQVLSITPGVFSYTPNGSGLGDAKITMRGLSDSFITLSFDGIPFNDTNGVSHHSWVFFPAPFLGGAVVDRSPGGAATIGQASFGGSIDLRSRVLEDTRRTSATLSAGSWNTNMAAVEYQSGRFGTDGSSKFMFNAHELKSNGYEKYNKQDRVAASMKYEYTASPDTVLTLFGAKLNLQNNTPNVKGITRANYNAGDYVDMLGNDPTLGSYWGYNVYDIDTDVEYGAIRTTLGGWTIDEKAYRYVYHNKQNYPNSFAALPALPNLAVSGTDKLNSYITMGNILRGSRPTGLGTLRVGLWFDEASSYRYQSPDNPVNMVAVGLPNFSEKYRTTTLQPYVEHEFRLTDALRVTPGIKYAQYKQSFNHLQDNGGAVGALGGTYGNVVNKIPTTVTGGSPLLAHAITYRDWMPSLDVHYMLQPNWSTYAQYAFGDQIPSTSVFDVKNAQVTPAPKATKAKTLQLGSVYKTDAWSVAGNVYHTKLDGAYTALPPDANGNIGYVLSGTETNQGVEVEGSVRLGGGFAVYANATAGSLKFANGQWVAGAPSDTQTLVLSYQRAGWNTNLSMNRVGRLYNDAKDGTHQAFTIDPVTVVNAFVNYTFREPFSFARQARVQLAVSNLLNRHNIVAVASPATGSTGAAPNAGDLLTVLPGRMVTLTGTLDF